jgi:copper(I)-binding protein
MAESICFRRCLFFLTLVPFFFIFPAETKSEITTIDVSNAWIRAAPGGAKMLAGYFNITNSGLKTDSLMSITSPHFKKIMMHRSVIRDGVATMVHIDKFPIAPGQTGQFAPGGYHLMLMQSVGSVGKSLPMKLQFTSGREISAKFTVKRQ